MDARAMAHPKLSAILSNPVVEHIPKPKDPATALALYVMLVGAWITDKCNFVTNSFFREGRLRLFVMFSQ